MSRDEPPSAEWSLASLDGHIEAIAESVKMLAAAYARPQAPSVETRWPWVIQGDDDELAADRIEVQFRRASGPWSPYASAGSPDAAQVVLDELRAHPSAAEQALEYRAVHVRVQEKVLDL